MKSHHLSRLRVREWVGQFNKSRGFTVVLAKWMIFVVLSGCDLIWSIGRELRRIIRWMRSITNLIVSVDSFHPRIKLLDEFISSYVHGGPDPSNIFPVHYQGLFVREIMVYRNTLGLTTSNLQARIKSCPKVFVSCLASGRVSQNRYGASCLHLSIYIKINLGKKAII